MKLQTEISQWQLTARMISPPSGTGLIPTVGGLSGPAFFPEGFGLTDLTLNGLAIPRVVVIGHNFGCENYRKEIGPLGREDDKATWRNLDSLLTRAGCSPHDCFRTNWFVGLQPGGQQLGRFLRKPNEAFEEACRVLLLDQITALRPKAILLLGTEVASRAYRIFPVLSPWQGAKNWADIDQSSIGHSVKAVELPSSNLRTSVAALLHPSFGAANQGRRMKNMKSPLTEVQIIRGLLADF